VATHLPSTVLRKHIREKIRQRIERLYLTRAEAAKLLGFSVAQISRLVNDQDIFALDRLVDAASRIGLSVRITVTRPYRHY
jgi:predicted XRE-type DNA-binding protein